MAWSEYERLVLDKLDSLESGQVAQWRAINGVRDDLTAVRVDVAGLKVKAGFWGAMFGTLGGILAALAGLFARYFK